MVGFTITIVNAVNGEKMHCFAMPGDPLTTTIRTVKNYLALDLEFNGGKALHGRQYNFLVGDVLAKPEDLLLELAGFALAGLARVPKTFQFELELRLVRVTLLCAYCGAIVTKSPSICGGCRKVDFCDIDCARDAGPAHRLVCTPPYGQR